MTTLRYERKTAKRNHKTACDMTGVPIEKGDRYFYGVFVDGRDLYHFKIHSVIQEMAYWSMETFNDDHWDVNYVCDYLLSWLRHHLAEEVWNEDADSWDDDPDVLACYEAARQYWREAREAIKQ